MSDKEPVYIDIKFTTMVVVMVKFVFAMIPAAIIVGIFVISFATIIPAFNVILTELLNS